MPGEKLEDTNVDADDRPMPHGIAWPRFEDGELVRLGDMAYACGVVGKVVTIVFHEGGWKVIVESNDGYSHDMHSSSSDGPCVMRPSDVDGSHDDEASR